MKTYLTYSIVITLLCLAWACKKDDSKPEPQTHKAKVYAVGTEYKSGQGFIAKYWEDGKETVLPGTGNSDDTYTRDIYVSDAGNTYVVGFEYVNSQPYARMWKNGELIDFFSDLTPSQASAIAIIGNDIYVAGSTKINNITTACYWKNSELTILGDQANTSWAFDLFVSGNDIYAVVDLTDGTQEAQAIAISVSDRDVYVVGFESNDQGNYVAKFWKGGEATTLTDGQYNACAVDVFADGADVYICGYEGNAQDIAVAKLWKNSNVNNLSNGISGGAIAKKVFVYNKDVYVGGQEGKAALIWKNGQPTKLTDGLLGNSVESVFVR